MVFSNRVELEMNNNGLAKMTMTGASRIGCNLRAGLAKTFMYATGIALSAVLFVTDALAEQEFVSVTAAYRERIALPPDAILEVELLDVSRADAPSTVLSYMRFKQDRVPFDLQLSYDPNLIEENYSYVVAARILSEGAVLFRTTSAYPVLTRGAGDAVDLVLQMTAEPKKPQPSGIAGVTWEAFEIGGRMFVGDTPPTLMFMEDGAFSLFAGCNQYTGKAELGDGTVAFPEAMRGTRRACVEPIQNLENDVLEAIAASTQYTQSGDNLALQRENGVVTLRFQKQQ